MSQGGRSHKPGAEKKPAEEALDSQYVPGESSPLSDPMRGVRAQREQASAQIARTLKVWRKAEAEPAAQEEDEKKEAEGGEEEGEEKADEKGEKKAGEEAKEGEEAKGADEGKQQEGEEKVQRKVFLANDGTPKNNQAQNKQFADAVKAIEQQRGKLSKDQIRQLHDAITGQDLGFHEIVEEGLRMFPKKEK